MGAQDFADWLPIRLYWEHTRLWVDWCHAGNHRLTDPFFDHTIERCLQKPFNLAFRRQTPIEILSDMAEVRPGLEPSGFVFHTSRAGSTLIAQMLAATPSHIVLSEPSLLEAIFGREAQLSGADEAQQVTWLRSVLGALGRPRFGEGHFFVKFDSWHTVHLPIIRKAFPEVPWIFLYRDPLEVLVSLSRLGGMRLLPGVIEPSELGLDWETVFDLPAAEYHARMLARICDAAIEADQDGLGRFVNYAELPNLGWTGLPRHFGFECGWEMRQRMQARAGYDAKFPRAGFEDDRAEKAAAVTAEMASAAAQWLMPRYEQMETMRRTRLDN